MLEKFFSDSSALLAITRKEVHGPAVIELIDRITTVRLTDAGREAKPIAVRVCGQFYLVPI